MLCDPEYRKGLELDALDPATVPPDLPAPAVPSVAGLTAAQILWLLADHYGLSATRTADIFPELGQLPLSGRPVTLVLPDVDRAGPVRGGGGRARARGAGRPEAPRRRRVLRLLADVPREFAVELAGGLPPGVARITDLDAPEWADPEGLALQAETLLDPQFGRTGRRQGRTCAMASRDTPWRPVCSPGSSPTPACSPTPIRCGCAPPWGRPAQPCATTARRSVPDPRAPEPEPERVPEPEPERVPEPDPAAARAPQAPGPDAHPAA
ncbi:hypothetical protein [Streptomyces platensis]|uniref:hypothetical protein n=1 Tax=Streptomyces platensis TaxID=58346 RepID=UPI00332027CC